MCGDAKVGDSQFTIAKLTELVRHHAGRKPFPRDGQTLPSFLHIFLWGNRHQSSKTHCPLFHSDVASVDSARFYIVGGHFEWGSAILEE